MSLQTQVQSLATRIGTEFKKVYGQIGVLGNLTTAAKTDLVSAVNEVAANAANAGASINDAAPSVNTVYSSTKTESVVNTAISDLVGAAPAELDTLQELATAIQSDESGIAAINTALSNRLRFDAAQVLDGVQQAQGQANLGLGSAATADSSSFDPAGSAAAVTIASLGAAAASDLTAETNRATAAESNAAQKAANLSDLADAPTARANLGLGSAATTSSAAYDAAGAAATAQANAVASSLQKAANLSDLSDAAVGRTNLSVYSQAEVGDVTTDFVATFEAALV